MNGPHKQHIRLDTIFNYMFILDFQECINKQDEKHIPLFTGFASKMGSSFFCYGCTTWSVKAEP